MLADILDDHYIRRFVRFRVALPVVEENIANHIDVLFTEKVP